jgi:hypothetical protein
MEVSKYVSKSNTITALPDNLLFKMIKSLYRKNLIFVGGTNRVIYKAFRKNIDLKALDKDVRQILLYDYVADCFKEQYSKDFKKLYNKNLKSTFYKLICVNPHKDHLKNTIDVTQSFVYNSETYMFKEFNKELILPTKWKSGDIFKLAKNFGLDIKTYRRDIDISPTYNDFMEKEDNRKEIKHTYIGFDRDYLSWVYEPVSFEDEQRIRNNYLKIYEDKKEKYGGFVNLFLKKRKEDNTFDYHSVRELTNEEKDRLFTMELDYKEGLIYDD